MIQFTRSLARQLRAVFRRVLRKGSNGSRPTVSFQVDRSGLRARLHHLELFAEYHETGSYPPETITLPLDALADFEARNSELVALEAQNPGTVQARWNAGVVPQVKEYDAPELDKLPQFPDATSKLGAADPGLLKALADARQSTSAEAIRYALDKVQLRGRTGEVVASDGRQLLLQSGFHFPFKDDAIVPIPAVFGSRELPVDGSMAIGKTDKVVTIQVGAWTFHLPIDTASRYPRVEEVIPSLSGGVTRCCIAPEDVVFLAQTLPRLPGSNDSQQTITLDLNGQAAIRVKGPGQTPPTELVLAQSEVTGKPVRLCTYRSLLTRTVELGFSEINVLSADKPVLCQDANRKFVFMPLGKEGIIPPAEDCQRIVSADQGKAIKPRPPEKRKASLVDLEEPDQPATIATKQPIAPVPVPGNGNGQGQRKISSNGKTVSNGSPTLMEEAIAVKDLLRDAYLRTNQLITAIRRQRKENQLVRTTLASLRQLQQVTG